MGLSCGCSYEWEGEGECYFHPHNYSEMPYLGRRKKCKSCGKTINMGEVVAEFQRMRAPLSEIEERISGEEIYLASFYHCEECADIFFNLDELGFCMNLYEDNMGDLLDEYKKDYHG